MKESDIRPQDLFNKYLKLSRQDIDTFFSDKSGFVPTDCPACGSSSAAPAFEKLGFSYVKCADCESLYLSPRPTPEMMDDYYDNSAAVKFWGTDFYRQTADARRTAMFRPRAELVSSLSVEYGFGRSFSFADVGAGYGLFLEEIRDLGIGGSITAIEPAPNLAKICRDRGFTVVEAPLERIAPGEADVTCATAFEVLEHVSSPLEFMAGFKNILEPGGIGLVTTLTCSGFDIRVLNEHAKAVYPPYHVNLMSVEGMRRLVERAELELIKLETPGKLDVDIVRNTLIADPKIDVGSFERWIASEASESQRNAFQGFLAQNLMSSHIRIIVRRPAV